MGKVLRQDKAAVQRILAKEIVPGDIVEVAGPNLLVKALFCNPLESLICDTTI